ncbi:MAG: hypothetical protein RLZZ210_79 [Pseudomonadota bacterium]
MFGFSGISFLHKNDAIDKNKTAINNSNSSNTNPNKTKKLTDKIKQNSFIKWINQEQQSQHSNAIGGACCASTSVAASQSVDDAAQAANGSGAKQFHSFNPDNSADIGSVVATSIANPLILHSCLGLWRELNHLHQKYKKHYTKISSDIVKNANENKFDIRQIVAKQYVSEHKNAFRVEKHLTSWLTAISSLMVVLKFTAEGVLGTGLLLSAIKSLGKVAQRCIQITKKSLDIHNNHKQKQACVDNLEMLTKLNDELTKLITNLEKEKNPSEFIQKKIDEYKTQLSGYQSNIHNSNKDLHRYPKLRKRFFQDIKLLAIDGLFWLGNAAANIGMATANFISTGHGFPLVAILTLILGSTFGVIYSNNKLLTGRYISGLTEAESGKLSYGNYEDFSHEHAKKEFDMHYDLYQSFKQKSKILNKPIGTKGKIFATKWAIRMLMFLSFGTYADSMIRVRRKFRAYKATLYKTEDSQLVEWLNEINTIVEEHEKNLDEIVDIKEIQKNVKSVNKNEVNLFEEVKKFEKQEYISKELAFNISKFQSNKLSKIKQTNWKEFYTNLSNTKNGKLKFITDKIKQINQKDFVIIKKYQKFVEKKLITTDDIKFIFESGPCCIHGLLDDVIDSFYTRLEQLKNDKEKPLSIHEYDSFKKEFEDLIRNATKSTFGKAGLQYSNRYVSKASSIIAQHQNLKLLNKYNKDTKLEYNSEKLNKLRNELNKIKLTDNSVIKEREDMYNNLSETLQLT